MKAKDALQKIHEDIVKQYSIIATENTLYVHKPQLIGISNITKINEDNRTIDIFSKRGCISLFKTEFSTVTTIL